MTIEHSHNTKGKTMNLKNATCKFAFLAGERLMDPDTIVNAGLFEDGQFDYRGNAIVETVEDITEAGSFHVHCTSENFSHLGDAVLKIARILKATGYELIDLGARCTDDVGSTEDEYWCLANGHIVAGTRQGAIGSILRDDDGGWRDTTGTVFGADNREFAALGVLSDVFGDQCRAGELLESIFDIAGAGGGGRPEVITREELDGALINILRAGFDAVETVDGIETVVANACRNN